MAAGNGGYICSLSICGVGRILHTIVENCHRLGINPKQYLTDVLTRLPGMLAKDAITQTPANWLKARTGEEQRKVA